MDTNVDGAGNNDGNEPAKVTNSISRARRSRQTALLDIAFRRWADMPARDMLMGLSGHSSRHYCNYCTVRGRGVHAPMTAPRGTDPNWRTYDPFALPKREHQVSKMYARHVEDTGDAEVRNREDWD